MNDKLGLSVKETAELLGLSERTVYDMCYHRQIPHRRVKGRGTKGQGKIIISRRALERWLEQGEPERKKGKKKAAQG